MHMVKVISLSQRAYVLLKRLKRPQQSFSDVIVERLGSLQAEKTETMDDLIAWIKSQPKREGKVRWSTQIDEILYGKKA